MRFLWLPIADGRVSAPQSYTVAHAWSSMPEGVRLENASGSRPAKISMRRL
jgi:hypothetical protein